jgi:hypothetical protein
MLSDLIPEVHLTLSLKHQPGIPLADGSSGFDTYCCKMLAERYRLMTVTLLCQRLASKDSLEKKGLYFFIEEEIREIVAFYKSPIGHDH